MLKKINTYEDLLIAKGIIDSEWNFIESGDEEKDCHHLYCIKGTKHYSIVVICSMLMAMERRGAMLSKYSFAINKGWLTCNFPDKDCNYTDKNGIINNVLLASSYTMEAAFKMLNYIDGVTLITMAKEMMGEMVWR
jgi:hypothetical protein